MRYIMPFKKGQKHIVTCAIDWQEIEAQAGRTIDDMYDEMQSCRLVGKSLAPYVGLLQGISGDCVRHELIRRGHKLRGRGGNNNPTGIKFVNVFQQNNSTAALRGRKRYKGAYEG
jgi:NADH:ubiquinone oxidoreductase subunit F (NADH-binding)